MEEWIKVYEEPINELPERIEDYPLLVNEILRDNAIPFQNQISIRDERNNVLELGGCSTFLEVYVQKEYEERTKDLLKFKENTKEDTEIELYLNQNEIKELENFEDVDRTLTEENIIEDSPEEYIVKMNKIENFEKNKSKVFLANFLPLMIIGSIYYYLIELKEIVILNKSEAIMVSILCNVCLIMIILDFGLTKYLKYKKKKIKSRHASSTIKKVIYPYQYSETGITEDFFKNTLIYEEFDHYNIYKAYDKITGKHKGKEILMSNLYLEYKEIVKSRNYSNGWEKLKSGIGVFFDGIFIKTKVNNDINSRVYIEPILWWERCRNYIEYSKAISDESYNKRYSLNTTNIAAEFEENFRIYEMGERKGTEILNENFMEAILNLKEKYNKDISICISKNIANIMINDLKLLDDKTLTKQSLSSGSILESINIVEEVVDVVSDFNII